MNSSRNRYSYFQQSFLESGVVFFIFIRLHKSKIIFVTYYYKYYFIRMDNKPLSIRPVRLGPLPIVQQIIDKIGIEKVFLTHVNHNSRDKIPVSRTLIIALLNVITERFPLYKMGEWALNRELISTKSAECFTDDRVGRALDRLFCADRAAITTSVVLNAL